MFRTILAALGLAALVSASAASAQTPPPTTSLTPTATATQTAPLPTIESLTADTEGEILRADGSFIRPEERDYKVTVSWDPAPGFAGNYLVYRVDTASATSVLVATLPSSGGGLRPSYVEPIHWTLPRTCYQVRAQIGQVLGPATEACTVPPVASGPAASVTVTPGPPDTGTGTEPFRDGSGPNSRWLGVVFLILTLAAWPTARISRRR